MPMQLAGTCLHVVLEEGLKVTAVGERCGVEQSVMSRHLRDLYLSDRHHKDGLQLITITQRIHGDRRERHVFLTERGHEVARQIGKALFDPKPVRVKPNPYRKRGSTDPTTPREHDDALRNTQQRLPAPHVK